jgi:hypothetical protein
MMEEKRLPLGKLGVGARLLGNVREEGRARLPPRRAPELAPNISFREQIARESGRLGEATPPSANGQSNAPPICALCRAVDRIGV